ncbi:hypothetical protein [Kutzneria albida]|uniref:Uncharacterized protein n=1 Tax=Kutzneria albida DSM 43870 TaxID=1449976 RepID=W5W129_9PSEU|nr:hypothetical protein [Kutzneria albida]AHH94888.1 hypothetical protein KALB_1515 [Kutzneria albida DSM 43870]
MEQVSPVLVDRWQKAYRSYQEVGVRAGLRSATVADLNAMVSVSRDVARAWRALGEVDGLPWWISAAVDTAAQAFDGQAREWYGRVTSQGQEGW